MMLEGVDVWKEDKCVTFGISPVQALSFISSDLGHMARFPHPNHHQKVSQICPLLSSPFLPPQASPIISSLDDCNNLLTGVPASVVATQ